MKKSLAWTALGSALTLAVVFHDKVIDGVQKVGEKAKATARKGK